MNCVFCGRATTEKQVVFTYEDRDRYIRIENVPAEVCERCGEKTFSPDVTDKILKISDKKPEPVKTTEIPIYDFAMGL